MHFPVGKISQFDSNFTKFVPGNKLLTEPVLAMFYDTMASLGPNE